MGKTLAEKILSENSGTDAHGEGISVANVNFLHDGTDLLLLWQPEESDATRYATPREMRYP